MMLQKKKKEIDKQPKMLYTEFEIKKMEDIRLIFKEIKKTAFAYVTEETVENFIKNILLLRSKSGFFQMTQTRNVPTLEFGGLSENTLTDITATDGETFITTVPLSSITQIFLQDNSSMTTLEIFILAGRKFTYASVLNEKRKDLREYALSLNKAISKER